ELGGGVDRAVRVGEVLLALARLDHALALHVHGDEFDPVAAGDLLELGTTLGSELGRADVAVGDLDRGESEALDLTEDAVPGLGRRVVQARAVGGDGREPVHADGDASSRW